MELNGRVALVTGGAGGIGGAVVRRLAKAGVSGVVINYRRSAKEAEALALEIERAGVKSMAIQADVQNDDQVKSMIAKIGADFGRLDILVNNAGVTHWVKVSDLEALTDAIWDEILDVNVKGAFRCARAAAKLLEANSGMIVNVSSISGVLSPSTMKILFLDKDLTYRVLAKQLRISDKKLLDAAYDEEIKVLEPRLEFKNEALQAIIDETGKVDTRARKIRPQDLIDRRYLDSLQKIGFFEKLWAGKEPR